VRPCGAQIQPIGSQPFAPGPPTSAPRVNHCITHTWLAWCLVLTCNFCWWESDFRRPSLLGPEESEGAHVGSDDISATKHACHFLFGNDHLIFLPKDRVVMVPGLGLVGAARHGNGTAARAAVIIGGTVRCHCLSGVDVLHVAQRVQGAVRLMPQGTRDTNPHRRKSSVDDGQRPRNLSDLMNGILDFSDCRRSVRSEIARQDAGEGSPQNRSFARSFLP